MTTLFDLPEPTGPLLDTAAPVLTPSTPTLRPYQSDALGAIRDAYQRGTWAQLVVLPTGTGKTVIFSEIPKLLAGLGLPERVLVLAHREELLAQAAAKLQAANRYLWVDIEQAEQRAASVADVVVASVQTLAARGGARLAKLRPESFGAVIVDEAHHATADSYQAVLRLVRCAPPAELTMGKAEDAPRIRAAMKAWWAAQPAPPLLLGVTATPMRSDGVGLEYVFSSVVYQKTLREMISAGWLAEMRGYTVSTSTDLTGVKTLAGDFNARQLAEAVNTPARNARAVAAWLALAKGRKTIAFTVDVQHAADLAEAFRRSGVPAAAVSGRDRAGIDAFERGDATVLTNCALLTEGYDSPAVSCILHARPTQSATLYMQMTGRGSRLAPGKTDCVVIDLADVARKQNLLALTDLFGLPRVNLNGRSATQTVEAIEAAQQGKRANAQLDARAAADEVSQYIQQIDLWAVPVSEAVEAYATLKWVEVAPNTFTLRMPVRGPDGALVPGANDLIRMSQDVLGRWVVQEIKAAGGSRLVGVEGELKAAFARTEAWIRQSTPDRARLVDGAASWRSRPATPKQIAALARFRCPPERLQNLTRGDATDLLDAVFVRLREKKS